MVTTNPNLKKKKLNHMSIPITIISGFLGSGKTTLLNHILTNQKGLKTAVLVNEFGKIGIDNDLILSTGEGMIELSNGCICCSINGELLEAIERLINREETIDYIIIETTGLADPLPVAMTILGSDLRDNTRLDSIITLIDAENFDTVLPESDIVKSQIVYGDILLLNKCDLVNDEKIESIIKTLKEIKTDARILKSIKGNVPLNLLLSVGLFETSILKGKNTHNKHSHDHHGHSHSKEEENKIEDFTSVSFETEKPFSLIKFQNFLDNKLKSNIFRAKGILWFSESERRHIFHLSGKRISIEDSDWEKVKKNQIIFIGKDIDEITILNQLESCVDI